MAVVLGSFAKSRVFPLALSHLPKLRESSMEWQSSASARQARERLRLKSVRLGWLGRGSGSRGCPAGQAMAPEPADREARPTLASLTTAWQVPLPPPASSQHGIGRHPGSLGRGEIPSRHHLAGPAPHRSNGFPGLAQPPAITTRPSLRARHTSLSPRCSPRLVRVRRSRIGSDGTVRR